MDVQLLQIDGLNWPIKRAYHSKSCHIATNVNTTHTFSSFFWDPPRGMYIYLNFYSVKFIIWENEVENQGKRIGCTSQATY